MHDNQQKKRLTVCFVSKEVITRRVKIFLELLGGPIEFEAMLPMRVIDGTVVVG
jgi:hypothetical protein